MPWSCRGRRPRDRVSGVMPSWAASTFLVTGSTREPPGGHVLPDPGAQAVRAVRAGELLHRVGEPAQPHRLGVDDGLGQVRILAHGGQEGRLGELEHPGGLQGGGGGGEGLAAEHGRLGEAGHRHDHRQGGVGPGGLGAAGELDGAFHQDEEARAGVVLQEQGFLPGQALLGSRARRCRCSRWAGCSEAKRGAWYQAGIVGWNLKDTMESGPAPGGRSVYNYFIYFGARRC